MTTDFRACARCGDTGGHHFSWCTDRPVTADVTREPTGGQGLREAIVRGFAAADNWTPDPTMADQEFWGHYADNLLALPELAALIADAERVRELEAAVARVRELAEYAAFVWTHELRRALDGEPQP